MPLYKEENFLIVHPGSQHTLFSFGLQDSLAPPQYRIPSIVYQDSITKDYKTKRQSEQDLEIHPIKASRIVDLDAFNYLLKIILQSVITNHPLVTINQIPLLLIVPSLGWSTNIEYITKYVIESLEFTAFNIIDLSLAATFGVGSSTNSVVVNVGYESIQIVPVVGYQSIKFAGKFLHNIGGKTLNEEIKKNLPNFSDQQIEDLKCSGIYEVLHEQDGNFYSWKDLQENGGGDEEEGDNFDVAKLVTKDNGPIAETGKLSGEEGEEAKPNKELETNSFIDSITQERISVGKERFLGGNKLIEIISREIYASLKNIPDIDKRQDCYDNIILVGSSFSIPGLKEAVLVKLNQDYLVRDPEIHGSNATTTTDGVSSAIMKYQQTSDDQADGESGSTVNQVPNSIKMAKYPDYFPEWKKPKEKGGSWQDVYFLGGEICGKQIFSTSSSHGRELFVGSDLYEERGPQSIWDVSV
ncbi:Actin-like protein ARP9 [Spathaspora sp. JA1]|nr:Actin-like protein ARP9 [Spathaspora sp. JA1]